MATTAFRCKLITPEAVVLDEQAVSANVPLWDGQMGFLPGRAPIVGQLGIGELTIQFADSSQGKGGQRGFFVDDGFVQMAGNQLTILAASAIGAEKLTESDALAEVNAANAAKTDGLNATELAQVQVRRRQAESKLRAARSFKAQGGF